MVLSNKKLKERLRAAKAELIVASEAQNNLTGKSSGNSGDLDSKAPHSLRTILNLDAQNSRLSKREKRRQKAQTENSDMIKNGEISGDAEAKKQNGSKSDAGELKMKRKRKGDESEASENVTEKNLKQMKKKKKKNGEISGDAEANKQNGSESDAEEVKKIRKRKRDESEASENMTEKKPKQMKKKKKKKKKKPKKNAENGKVNGEGVEQTGRGATGEQLVAKINVSTERKNAEVCDKVYVGGIPYYSTEDDIRSYFEGCGTITGVDCMTFPDTGKFRGIAIITFKTEAAAKRALALDGSDMGGLFLKIQPFKSSKVNKSPNFCPSVMEGYNRIYVGNLSWDVTEDDLRKLFANCTIESIRFGEDKVTGEFKGYGHVDFGDGSSLNMALKLDQKIVCGRPIRISCAVPMKGDATNLKPKPKDNQVSGGDGDEGAANKIQVTAASSEANAVSSKVVNSSEANTVVVSSKIRRRTCYECGERGHISSLCPKRKGDDLTNPGES